MPRNWLQKVCDQLAPTSISPIKKVQRRPRGRVPMRVEPLEVRTLLANPVVQNPGTIQLGENIGVNLAAPYIDPVTGTNQANTINGTAVGTLNATDADGHAIVAWTITGGNTNNAFAINNAGQITVNNFAAINFENNPSFALTVTARDSNNETSAGFTVNIAIQNRNDIPYIPQNQGFSIPENAVAGTVLNGSPVQAFTAVNQNAGLPAGGMNPNDPNFAGGRNNLSGQTDSGTNSAGDGVANGTLRYEILRASSSTVAQGGAGNEVQNISKDGALLAGQFLLFHTSQLPVTVTTPGTALVDEVQNLNMGAFPNANRFFTLTFNGQTTRHLHYDSTAAEVQAELELLTTIGSGNVSVTGGGNGAGAAAPWDITFIGTLSKTNVSTLDVTAYTDSLNYAALAGQIATALSGLPTIGAGNVGVTALAGNTGWQVTFQGALANTNVNQIGVLNRNDILNISSDTPTLGRLTIVGNPDPYLLGSRSYDGQAGLVSGFEFQNAFFGNAGFPVLIRVRDLSQVNSQGTNVLNPSRPTLSYTEYIGVAITDQSEAAPDVTDKIFNISESSPNGAVVGKVDEPADPNDVTDREGTQSFSYAIVGGNSSGAFAINALTSEITVADSSQLDFETGPAYRLLVRVTDSASPNLSTIAAMDINLTDFNEPTTIPDGQAFNVEEGAPVGTQVGAVSAFDPDRAPPRVFQYFITNGNIGNTFAINENTGVITVLNNALLNTATQPSFSLGIRVVDRDLQLSSDVNQVQINVVDVNVSPPILNDYTFSLDENRPNGFLVGTLTAVTTEVNQTVSYTLLTAGTPFTLNSATGQLTVNNIGVDFEAQAEWTLVVQASDNGSPSLFDTAIVTVFINDRNEQIDINAQTRTVAENAIAGTNVGAALTVTDPDDNDGITQGKQFSIVSGNIGNVFGINAASGQITIANPANLNFEARSFYDLVIQVNDSGLAPSTADIATIRINVTNANDTPVLNDQALPAVIEHRLAGTIVGTVVATDQDVGQTLSYAIIGGNPGGAFAINAATGEVSIANPGAVDFVQNPIFNLVVQVTDAQGTSTVAGGASDTGIVTITVLDANAPTINDQVFAIAENSGVGTVVGNLGLTGGTGPFSFSIASGNTGGTFAVDATGNITVANSTLLNFETNPVFTLQVAVIDNSTPQLTDNATITINVNDLNELPTVNNPTFSLPENSPVATVVGGVTATDPDAGQTLNYTISSGNTDNAFVINASTGVISVNTLSAINFEVNPVFNLVVAVSDGIGSVNSNVTINLTDINEAPAIGNQTVSINENQPNGTTVATFAAVNPETAQTVTYAITAGNDGTFAINPTTGVVTVANSTLLNFEATPTYSLTIVATDTGSGTAPNVNTSTATLTVNVNNLNELPTVDNPTFSLPENSPVATVVGGVTATDPDAGQTLTYTISSGNTGNAFVINASTGVISVNTLSAINFEVNPVFNLVVAVSDGVGSVNSNVTINLTDINEAPAIGNQTVSINENQPNGTTVATFAAVNPETAQTVTYAITAGNDGTFAINPTTGVVTVANSTLLNFEATPTYSLTIVATDTGSGTAPNVNTSTATLTVNVNNLNELPTVNNPTFSLPENSPVGTVVGGVTATDPDAGQTLTYTISSGNTGNAFVINSATGVISVNTAAAVDFEVNPVFNLVVAVSDGIGSVNSNVTINLTDAQDSPVVASATVFLAENSPAGTPVHAVVASDQDAGQTLTYAITAGNVNANGTIPNVFTIDPATGAITVAQPLALDFENQPPFVLTVTVTDNGVPARSSTATIVVRLTDANDAPHMYNASVNILENSPQGALVLDYKRVASDRDRPNQTLTYAIVGGNTSGAFVIDAATGLITIANPAAVDFEVNPTFNLTMQVTDDGVPPLTSTAQLVVNVGNVNDAPVITNKSVLLAENSPVGTVVTSAGATDQDAGQSLTYAITAGNQTAGGNYQDIFAIDPATGVITVANPAGLDWENQPPFNLTVTVTDSGSPALSSSAVIRVVLTNVNDAPSVYAGFITRPENMAQGTTVLDYKIVGRDQDAGQTLTFAIIGGNTGNAFAIDPTTGIITVNNPAAVDFETNPVFNLTMQVTDNGTPSLSSTANLRITLTNLNDAPVVPPQAFLIPENGPQNAYIGMITANDGDVGQTKTFAITAGNTDNAFSINPATGELRINNPAAMDFETNPFFNLTVTVTDNGNPAASGSGIVTVTLANVNDAPTILPQTFSVAENSAAGVLVGNVVAVEADAGQSITYAITAGNTLNAFTINAQTGQLTVNNPQALNFETTPQFQLTVRVTDNGQPAQQRSATMTINLTNVNEAPRFTLSNPLFQVLETAPQGAVVGTNAAVDPDANSVLTYAIISGNNNGAFSVDSAGNIRVANPAALDFESGQTNFQLGIRVTDNGNPALSATTNVAITVLNANDPPVVQPRAFTIFENSLPNAFIGTIAATDQDPGQTRTFSITGGNVNGAFKIDPTNGNLSVNNAAALDFETTPVFNLTVTATDNGSPAAAGSATIVVNLLNRNEPPVVPSQQFTVQTAAANGTVIGNVVATDPDAGQTRTYSIVGGNGFFNNIFSINATTGQLTVNNRLGILSNGQVYNLQVRVTDNGSPALSATGTVRVTVSNSGQLVATEAAPAKPKSTSSGLLSFFK